MEFNNDPIADFTATEIGKLKTKGVVIEGGSQYNRIFELIYKLKATIIEKDKEIAELKGMINKADYNYSLKLEYTIEEQQRTIDELKGGYEKLKVEVQYYLYGIEILKKLFNLKHYKDTVGKDSIYEREQPQTWKQANDFLNTLVNLKEVNI